VTLAQAMIGLGCVAGLLAVIYGPWQWMCTDFARQALFEKRDAIFDLARAGKLSFEGREYQTIRSSLQASIRFAHALTLPRALILGAALSANGHLSRPSQMSRAIDAIADPDTRSEVQRLVDQAARALLIMIIVKSPIAFIVFVFSGGLIGMIEGAREAAKRIERRAGEALRVEAEAAPESDGAAPVTA
jgi:hypothetical protein